MGCCYDNWHGIVWLIDELFYLTFGLYALSIASMNIENQANYETLLLLIFGVMTVALVLISAIHHLIIYVWLRHHRWTYISDGRYATENWTRRPVFIGLATFLLVNAAQYGLNSAQNSYSVNTAAAICSIASLGFEFLYLVMWIVEGAIFWTGYNDRDKSAAFIFVAGKNETYSVVPVEASSTTYEIRGTVSEDK